MLLDPVRKGRDDSFLIRTNLVIHFTFSITFRLLILPYYNHAMFLCADNSRDIFNINRVTTCRGFYVIFLILAMILSLQRPHIIVRYSSFWITTQSDWLKTKHTQNFNKTFGTAFSAWNIIALRDTVCVMWRLFLSNEGALVAK